MEKGNDWYMILEDDAVFNVTPARMDELMERIPANAEFVSWGTSRPEGWRPKDLELVKFYPVKIFPCTHAYMIKPATARKLVAYFNELDICDTIDLLLVNHIYKKINVYLANYPIISQKSVLETLPLEKRTFTYPSLLI